MATTIPTPQLIDAAYRLPAQEVLSHLDVSPDRGLTDDEVVRRRRLFGPNTVVSTRAVSVAGILLHQFLSPVVYLLGAATALAFYFGELEEGTAIATVIVINALIGFVTELKAARSIETLRALGALAARVRREGHVRVIAADELVPGDIALIEAGDAISADLRIIEASGLAVDESTLTGESVAVEKSVAAVAAAARLAERRSMLFKGTAVTRGSGLGVVTATGLRSELGRVSQLVEEAEPGASPLERHLAQLSTQLVWATLAVAIVIAGVGLATGKDPFLMVEAAIALAVAAIPEGLPIVATLALARGMWRMARQNALVERLSAVETLGATTIILTDKTGTLTENRMTVRRLWVPDGEIDLADNAVLQLVGDEQAARLLEIAVLCNDAALERANDKGSGDPMELALLRAGLRGGLRRAASLQKAPLVRKYSFDTATRMMATVHRTTDGYLFAIKGAPEAVLAACSDALTERGTGALDDGLRHEWLARVDDLGHHGLRVLACAMKHADHAVDAPYQRLTFVGLIALEDPARANVPQAIQECRQAGVRVVMVTGDHAVTARSVGRAVGLGEAVDNIVEGADVARLIEDGNRRLRDIGIFARVSPSEKLDVVRAYRAEGEIVAMTGDGVNDAPALRQADIGVAMGLRGTDVAREAAAMILLDDAFPTIVKAIREGRVIFGNIRRFVAYLLSCNLSEILVVGLAVVSALPLPILPLQILYLNLVTDVFPAFALAMGEGSGNILKHPPRDPKEPILTRAHWIAIVLQSLALATGTFGALALARFWLNLDDRSVITVTFLTLAFAQLWHVFDMRPVRARILHNEIVGNPWLWASLALCSALLIAPGYLPPVAHILHLAPPTPAMWALILALSAAPMIVIQAVVLLRETQRTRVGT